MNKLYLLYKWLCFKEICVAVILEEGVTSSKLYWTDGCRDWSFLSFSKRIAAYKLTLFQVIFCLILSNSKLYYLCCCGNLYYLFEICHSYSCDCRE